VVNSPKKLGAVLITAFLGWMFDGLEMGMFPLIARPALQQMQLAQGLVATDAFVGEWMGYVTAAFLVGAAAGGVVFGWLGDKVGRVRAMATSILCYSVFTGLVYFAQAPWHLLVTRFIAALGMGGEWSLGVALVMEVWPEKHRPLLAGVIGAAANVGFALIAVIGLSFQVTMESWRWIALVGAAPAFLTFFIRLHVPESERWHEVRRAQPEARPLRDVLRPPLLRSTLYAMVLASIALIGTWGSVQWLPLWADKMAQEQSVEAARAEQRNVLGAVAKQISLNDPAIMARSKELKNHNAKAYAQINSAIGAVVGCLLGGWLGGRLGRRQGYFLLCLISLASCAYLFRGVNAYGWTFLVLTFVVGGVTAAFYGWFPLYLPELFPTRVRATGQGLSFNAGRILAAAGALQMGVLMRQFDGDYGEAGGVITLIYLLGLVVIWFAPETRGQKLPE
jgi:MFS transporter, SHS family, sialic acid transporter